MKIKEFGKTRVGHSFRKRLVSIPYGKSKVIKPRNISSDRALTLEETDFIRSDTRMLSPLKAGDVLIINKGRFAAAVFDFPDEDTWIVPSSIIVLTITDSNILPAYITLYMNSARGQRQFQKLNEVSTVPFVSRTNLMEMDIPIPPLEKQNLLVNLGTANRRYAELTMKKRSLINNILNNELR
jgi:restriction endonuclease S subunit